MFDGGDFMFKILTSQYAELYKMQKTEKEQSKVLEKDLIDKSIKIWNCHRINSLNVAKKKVSQIKEYVEHKHVSQEKD